jgi:hypothetical protein
MYPLSRRARAVVQEQFWRCRLRQYNSCLKQEAQGCLVYLFDFFLAQHF